MDEREALERLRAADPAAGAEPDDARLRPMVEARRAGTGQPPAGSADAAPPAVPDELAARRSRRLLPMAAAVAAALAVGSAGFAVGRNMDTPPPNNAVPAVRPVPDRAGLGTAQPETMAAIDMGFAGYGRTSFTASGLGTEGGTAAAWAFDAAGAYTAESAARAAAAFGLEGEPRQEEAGGGWMVGAPDGSGPFLHLMPDGSATVSYYDPELSSFLDEVSPQPLPAPEELSRSGAGTSGDAGIDDGAVSGPAVSGPAVVDPSPPEGEQSAVDGTDEPAAEPDAEQAPAEEPGGEAPEGPVGTVYETIAALGLDPDAVEYETGEHWAGDEVAVVTAYLLVDGERAGTSWYAEVADGEVLSFSGPLAPLVELGEYDVVGPAEAVERLSDPRFGHSDYLMAAGTMIAPEPRPWGTPPAAPPAPGTPVPWQVHEVTITGAELTLTMTTTDDGVALLVPAYSLSDSDGGTWTVVALAEHELAF